MCPLEGSEGRIFPFGKLMLHRKSMGGACPALEVSKGACLTLEVCKGSQYKGFSHTINYGMGHLV